MADKIDNKYLDEEEKAELIQNLADELVFLRTRAGISQDDVAKIIGVSRQTYGDIERKNKSMTWATYLALIFFFEHSIQTSRIIKQLDVYPEKLITKFNNGEIFLEDGQFEDFKPITVDHDIIELIECLDEQGLHSLKTFLMIEYARCQRLPGDYIIKSFDGKNFNTEITDSDLSTRRALKRIREKRKKND